MRLLFSVNRELIKKSCRGVYMILLLSDVTKMLATLKKEVEQFSSDENTTNLSVLGEKK